MTDFFYLDANGTKQGPVSSAQLKDLVNQGIITPQTDIETDGGRKGKAGQINGLFPEVSVPPVENPFASPPPIFTNDANVTFGKVLAFDKGTNASLAVEIVFLLVSVGLMIGGLFILYNITHPDMSTYTYSDSITVLNIGGMLDNKIKKENIEKYKEVIWSIAMSECLMLGGLIYLGIIISIFRKTEIMVYENGVAGKGGGKAFEYDFTLRGFQLSYDKITSVETTRNEIVVDVSGTRYRCGVANPADIQRIILQQQRAKLS